MHIQFSIQSWAACIPASVDENAWLRWLEDPVETIDAKKNDLPKMSALLKRRLGRMGRAALQAAYNIEAETPKRPAIFASRYGDLNLAVEQLRTMADSNFVSPTNFSHSVHNAIGALYSIARGDHNSYCAISGGPNTLAAAFVEAVGQLHDGASQVLLVNYDEPVPALFSAPTNHAKPKATYAWACVVVPPLPGNCIQLRNLDGQGLETPEIDVHSTLKFLSSSQKFLEQGTWEWTRGT